MRDATYRLTLDVSNRSYQTQLTAKLNDSARTILANLTEDGVPYTIEDGCSAVIMIKKPDGNVLFNDCEILNNNVVKYEFTSQTVSTEGLLECEIRVYGNYNTILTSPRFRILVEANVYDDGQVESESEFSALTAAITAVNTLDLDVSKVGDTATITLTKKDGTEEEVEIHDGASAEIVGATATVGDSQGTPTVLVTEGGTSLARTFAFAFDGLKGETGPAGKITEVTASIDHMAGYPRVVVTEGGTDEAKTLNFAFHNLKGEQGATGPRGEKGETGDVGTISNVTASVDGNVGTPTVTVTEGGTQQEKTYDFAFHNLKGIQGEKGVKGDVGVISGMTASVDNYVGTPSVTVTEGGTASEKTYDLAFHNLKGDKGDKGDTGEITSVTASVDSNVGTPEVTVVEGGTSSEKTIAFTFKNLKGQTGDAGKGIVSVVLVSGTHAPGTTDIYRITFTDSTHVDFGVYNGADGGGATIAEMADVNLISLANGQTLKYDYTAGKWKMQTSPQ